MYSPKLYLAHRFDPANAFRFDDFNKTELRTILKLKCKSKGLHIGYEAAKFAVSLLEKQRVKPNFGNAGAVDSMISAADIKMRARRQREAKGSRHELKKEDFMPRKDAGDVKRGMAALDDLYRADDTKKQLENIGKRFKTVLESGRAKEIKEMKRGLNFLVKGGPGTGKSTIARCLAGVLHELGLLSSDTLVSTSALKLQAKHVGHTGPLVKEKMQEARGGVLFIDEAYELGDIRGSFAKKVVTTLTELMTTDEHKNTAVVLAGYKDEMESFINSTNPGFSSRFQEVIEIRDWSASDCAKFLLIQAKKDGFTVGADAKYLEGQFQRLYERNRSKWANARDAIQVLRNAKNISFTREDGEKLTIDDLHKSFRKMDKLRPEAARFLSDAKQKTVQADFQFASDTNDKKRSVRQRNRVRRSADGPAADRDEDPDAVKQEEKDDTKLVEKMTEEQKKEAKAKHKAREREEKRKEREEREERDRLEKEMAKMRAELKNALNKAEQKRIQEELRKLEEARKAAEEKRKKAEAYRVVCSIGQCPMGFGYTHVGNGWRCNAWGPGKGSHFVSDEAVSAHVR